MNSINFCSLLNRPPNEATFEELEQTLKRVPEGIDKVKQILNRFIEQIDPAQADNHSMRASFDKYCLVLNSDKRSSEHPFVEAVKKQDSRIIHAFLQFQDEGFDINCTNTNQMTAAHVAAANGDIVILDELSSKGLDLTSKDIFSNTPLHWAVLKKQEKTVGWLIEHNVELDEPNTGGFTAIQLAEKERFSSIVQNLLNAGASLALD